MSVYVDGARHRLGRMQMGHMLADTTAELLAMADRIGVARKWLQNAGTPTEHFDVCWAKRVLAVSFGAIKTDGRGLVDLIRTKRAGAQPRAAQDSDPPRIPEVRPMGDADERHEDYVQALAEWSKDAARLRDAEAREKRYREALELLERRYGQDPDARTHHDNCQHVDCIARRALTGPVDLGGPTPADVWAHTAHRSRHRVGYVSMGLPCFYCTAEAGEECRDEPDKRTPPPSTKGP